jgi:hypothetical protein
MSQAKRLSPRRRSGRAVPVLGAAGLLVLAGSASAEAPINSTMPPSGVSYPVLLGEEETFDVSLATFNVFDKEKSNSLLPRVQLARGGCGGAVAGVATAVVVAEAAEAVEVVAPAAAAEVAESVSALEVAAVAAALDVDWAGGESTA